MPYQEVPEFIRELRRRQQRSSAALALEFLILCAARTGEALGARWTEIDWANGVWTLPPDRTKQGREHTVPLSDRAVELLALQRQYSNGSEFIFTGYSQNQLADKSMYMLLKDMGLECTVHGFRSSFRDWAGDTTLFPREHVEACLAHRVGNDVENSYRRLTGLEKRREIMTAWTDYCSGSEAK
jgi:integrase